MENLENFICKIAIKMYMGSILTIFFGGKQYPEIPGGYPGFEIWTRIGTGPEPTFENRNRTGTGNLLPGPPLVTNYRICLLSF